IFPQRQCLPTTFRSVPCKSRAKRSELSSTSPNDFSRGNGTAPRPIAGGKFSTDELYANARALTPGTAAEDTAGDGQRVTVGQAKRIWAGTSVQFSARPKTTLAGRNGPHSGGAASDGRRLVALRASDGASIGQRRCQRRPDCLARRGTFRAGDTAFRYPLIATVAGTDPHAPVKQPPRMGAICRSAHAESRCSPDGPADGARGDCANRPALHFV